MYETVHGSFPPAYTVDQQGRPLHSWRVLILPYLEELELYQQIRLDEPWNSEHNSKFAQRAVSAFRCPSHGHHGESRGANATNYLAVVGPHCIFRGAEPTKLEEITDGISKTLVVAEVNQRSVPWMQPVDISAEEFVGQFGDGEADCNHDDMLHVAFADGQVHAISVDASPADMKAATTRNAGDTFNLDEAD